MLIYGTDNMAINKDKLARVKELAKIVDDSMSREEVMGAFKKILEFVKQIETKLSGKVDSKINSELTMGQEAVKDFKKEISTLKGQVLKQNSDALT